VSFKPREPVDARLVSFENTYMYGDTRGAPITETTPTNPQTHKGKVRLAMAEQLRLLHDDGVLAVTTARASDYIGPRGTTAVTIRRPGDRRRDGQQAGPV